VMKAGHANAAFLCDIVQRLAYFRVRPTLRDAEVTRDARDARNAHGEIAVRKVDSASIFGNKRMAVPDFAANGLNLFARAGREENIGNFSPVELIECILGASTRIRARVDQRAFESGEDEVAGSKQGADSLAVSESNLKFHI
jgi:hypothetical protein